MSPVGRLASERTGYPAQKPQSLARRIILASSNLGDIILDCFAGCAYVPVAVDELGQSWIACDMSPSAFTIIRRQFSRIFRARTPALHLDSDFQVAMLVM